MAKYNRTFELSRNDLDLIEIALRKVATKETDRDLDVKAVHELLGRLHNQKVFYRPQNRVYVSG